METPYLSVVIPAFREEKLIVATLETVQMFLAHQGYAFEILVVDDGSPDGTAAVVERMHAQHKHVRLIRHTANQGKGAAVRTGMLAARGTYALFADADNSTPVEELPKLLRAAEAGTDIVMASRYLPESRIAVRQSPFRRFMSRAGNLLFWLVLGLRFADTRCGFKLYNARARQTLFTRQRLPRWGFDTELLVIAAVHKLTVREVPVTWYDRAQGTVHPIRDAVRSLTELRIILTNRWKGYYA